MVAVKVWQCGGSFFQVLWPLKERHLSFALNVELWKLVPNSHRTFCVRISISLKMDPDLIFGPDGKQIEVVDFFLSEEHTLGQPYWNKAKKYISNAPRTCLLLISVANMVSLSS